MASSNEKSHLRQISLSHNSSDSQASALRLIFTLLPEWEHTDGEVKLTRFTDGITNTLLKAVKYRPGYTEEQLDAEAVLLRAYGKGTEILIDREKETASHLLLASHNLAQPLLARFQNGMMYRFIRGKVCSPSDLTKESVWRATADRLGQWHAVLPVLSTIPDVRTNDDHPSLALSPLKSLPPIEKINAITPGKVTPNVWTVMQKWIFALPSTTERERSRNATLQKELERTVVEFGDLPGLGEDGLVLAHCDLLSGNVIMEPTSPSSKPDDQMQVVSFIDYEYATPAPAAFDLANHFAEWGGFECDYSVLPTRSTRRKFLASYLASYHSHLSTASTSSQKSAETNLDTLCELVDRFRGIPGFYWGIWALIQATISQIDFDYAAYAEVRLSEYWAWREEEEGTRKGEIGLREKRWMEE